ncbi:MAG: hypothetical protein B7Y99_08745 [Caulobacterales bacterium 32-69-10]|nr:MAG: hypothetical protein B7Y99_08745 [Caulobacterales bacterium 32-69-10]
MTIDAPTGTTARSAPWCYAVAGWSGFLVMVVELIGGRLIAPFFGSSIYVWGAVIFVFMLGLAIGYLLGGIWSRSGATVHRLCGILAAAALATLPVVLLGDLVLNAIFDHTGDPRMGSLLTCFALFFIPAILSGMVSPYAVRLIVRDEATSGRSAGYLYFVSTVGSSAGTLMTSFYLVLWFEVNQILLAGIAISVLLAAAGALATRNKA